MTNSSGTAIAFGTATATSFTNGVATVSGTGNGAMKLYKAQTALITISDGSINNGSGLSVTVGAVAAASISLTAWEQPREASRPDECFPRSDASSAGDCLGDGGMAPRRGRTGPLFGGGPRRQAGLAGRMKDFGPSWEAPLECRTVH